MRGRAAQPSVDDGSIIFLFTGADFFNTLKAYATWFFGDMEEDAELCGQLVKAGIKTATSGLVWEMEKDGEKPPRKDNWDYFSVVCRAIGREPSETMPLACQRFQLLYPKAGMATIRRSA